MNQLPVDFWPQLFARLKSDTPKFYQLIVKNSIVCTAIAAGISFGMAYAQTLGIDLPAWLTHLAPTLATVFTFLAGVGSGSATVAATTIQTAATPALKGDGSEPTTEDLLRQVADLQAQVTQLQAGSNTQKAGL